MALLAWIRCKFLPSKVPEKELIVKQIERETVRLNGAVEGLKSEIVVVKRSRVEMSRMLDDTLQAINKEIRR